MSAKTTEYTETLGKLLRKYRKNAKLSQKELAQRMNEQSKSNFRYISRLETGLVKKPFLETILNYLDACGVIYAKFFTDLYKIRLKIFNETIQQITKLQEAENLTLEQKKKIDRDTTKFSHNIKYPKTPYPKLDMERIKTLINHKVKMLLTSHRIPDEKKRPYFDFTDELILNYESGQIPEIAKKYQESGLLNKLILDSIKSIVYKIFLLEKKRREKQKPLTSEKQKKAAASYMRYRMAIEPILAEVQRLLGELNVPMVYNQFYQDYARQCYKALRKYADKDNVLLTQKLANIKREWMKNKLDPEILEKIKEIVIRHLRPIQTLT